MDIKNRWTGIIIFESKLASIKLSVEAAVKSSANLRGADLSSADLRGADLRSANLSSADLSSADLRGADLRDANLRDANLRDANIDFSCWPLWCGSKSTKIDERIAKQLLAHAFAVGREFWPGEITKKQIEWLNDFHRIKDGSMDEFK